MNTAGIFSRTFVFLALCTPAMAENACMPAPIEGWKAEWNRANCAESTVQVEALGAKAKDDDPHCASDKEFADATKVMKVINDSSAAAGAGIGAKVGTAVGGPVGTIVGGIVGAGATTGFNAIMKNNYHVDFAKCTDVCVHLPVKAHNVLVQGFSSPMPEHPGIALCDMTDGNQPGRCDIPHKGRWTAMSLYTNASDPTTGQVYCSTAKNWSENEKPTLGLRVMYDMQP